MKRSLALVVLLVSGTSLFTPRAAAQPTAAQPAVRAAERPTHNRPDSEPPIRIVAAPYKGADADTYVVLVYEIDTSALGLRAGETPYNAPFRVDYAVTDRQGRTRSGTAYEGTPELTPETSVHAARYGLRVSHRLALKPGSYRLRVSAASATETRSVAHDLDVPDFEDSLTMSGVFVSSTDAGEGVTVAAQPSADLVLPAPPTARRDFAPGDTLKLFAEVYESAERIEQGPAVGKPGDANYAPLGDHTTHVVAELRDRDGTILLTRAGQRWNGRERTTGRHAFVAELPLAQVPSGRYVVRVRARANIGNADSASRDISIRVR